ncbi:hypothetical protein DUNSADRAFT_2718 [Dunaliella salina]|uniref:MYND-type domain-containing protein n=1 Tax=Dunaliella salina TaxID=3046 RepID=A0ABQ7GV97_DUNSA|nr:hypothetical protein DUNSADRAFT_2718 [Dunaliella salina]|eukprot:KAF5838520.1 hypothetical protein DUNSADRAFT_2718 [Dunaliella salina]
MKGNAGAEPTANPSSRPTSKGPDAASAAAFAKLRESVFRALQAEGGGIRGKFSEDICERVAEVHRLCSSRLGWLHTTSPARVRAWQFQILHTANRIYALAEGLSDDLGNLLLLFMRRGMLYSGIHDPAFDTLKGQNSPQDDTAFCISILGLCLGIHNCGEAIRPDVLGKFYREEFLPEPWQSYDALAHMHWHPRPVMLACQVLTSKGALGEPEAMINCRNFILRLLVPHANLPKKPAGPIIIEDCYKKFRDPVLRDNDCMRAIFGMLQDPDNSLLAAPLLDSIIDEVPLEGPSTAPIIIQTKNPAPHTTLRHMVRNGAAGPLACALNLYRIHSEIEQRLGVDLSEAYNPSHSKCTAAALLCCLLRIVQKAAGDDQAVYGSSEDVSDAAWPEELLEAYLRAFMKVMEHGLFQIATLMIVPRASMPKAAHIFNRFPGMMDNLIKLLLLSVHRLSRNPFHFEQYGIHIQFVHDLLAAGQGTGVQWRVNSSQAQTIINTCTTGMNTLTGMLRKCKQREVQPALAGRGRDPVVAMMSKTLVLLLRLLSLSNHARAQFMRQPTSVHQSWVAAVQAAELEQCGFSYEATLARDNSEGEGGAEGVKKGKGPFSAWFKPAPKGMGLSELGGTGSSGVAATDESSKGSRHSSGRGATMPSMVGGSSSDVPASSAGTKTSSSKSAMPGSSNNSSGGGGCAKSNTAGSSSTPAVPPNTSNSSSSGGSSSLAVCFKCGRSAEEALVPKLLRCGRCKATRYCSRDCQLKDYKVHKLDCKEKSG